MLFCVTVSKQIFQWIFNNFDRFLTQYSGYDIIGHFIDEKMFKIWNSLTDLCFKVNVLLNISLCIYIYLEDKEKKNSQGNICFMIEYIESNVLMRNNLT